MRMKMSNIKPLFVIVFFVLVTFAIPVAVSAGPPIKDPKCPCFTDSEVQRAINKATDVCTTCADDYIRVEVYDGLDYHTFEASQQSNLFCRDRLVVNGRSGVRTREDLCSSVDGCITYDEAGACLTELENVIAANPTTVICGQCIKLP